jgi:hypothetical protein
MVKREFNLAKNGGRLLALLLALCWFWAPTPASGAARSTLSTHLFRAGIAVADLNGDHLPDVASGVNTGHTSKGYSYRVDVDLSGNAAQKSFFSVYSEEPNGLNIEAIDIDGDHDLDLVITGRLSLQPIGVWINDGSGGFTPGDLQQYALSIWESRQSLTSPRIVPTPAVQFEWRRLQIALTHERIDFRPTNFSLREAASSAHAFSRIPPGSARFRAPPSLQI